MLNDDYFDCQAPAVWPVTHTQA